jgi:hypothetical protein
MSLALAPFLVPLAWLASGSALPPAARYVVVPFAEMAWQGAAPAADDETASRDVPWDHRTDFEGYVVVDGGGEGYLEYTADDWSFEPRRPVRCALRVPGASAGSVFLAKPDFSGFEAFRFEIPDGPEDPAAKDAFHAAMEAHYERLLQRDLPGAAWFRHRAALARAARGLPAGATGDPARGFIDMRGPGRASTTPSTSSRATARSPRTSTSSARCAGSPARKRASRSTRSRASRRARWTGRRSCRARNRPSTRWRSSSRPTSTRSSSPPSRR